MFRFAQAVSLLQDERREHALEEARAALAAGGHEELAGEADALLAEVWWHRGHHDRSLQYLERHRGSSPGCLPPPAKAHVLQPGLAVPRTRGGERRSDSGRRGSACDGRESRPRRRCAHALDNLGVAKGEQRRPTGVADLERSVEIALAAGSPEAGRAYNNLAAMIWVLETCGGRTSSSTRPCA